MIKPSTIIGVAANTRLRRIERTNGGWLLWTDTVDYNLGTYIYLDDQGGAAKITERAGEGPDIIQVKPVDSLTPNDFILTFQHERQ